MIPKTQYLSEKEVEVVLEMIKNKDYLSSNIDIENNNSLDRIIDMRLLLEEVGIIEESAVGSGTSDFSGYDLTLYGQMLNKLSSTEILERLAEECNIRQSYLSKTLFSAFCVLILLYVAAQVLV